MHIVKLIERRFPSRKRSIICRVGSYLSHPSCIGIRADIDPIEIAEVGF